MIKPLIPANEKERLAKLYEYSLLDSLEEEEYDQITRLASKICDTPISLISLIDKDRQWFKSKVGLNQKETERDTAFCAHAINEPDHTFIVEDSRKDERFHDNPLVADDPNVVFYAGVPLVCDDQALGTLCVIDNEPRELSDDQLESLSDLANQLVKLFELRRNKLLLERTVRELEQRNKNLDEFARIAAHDIKSPLGNIYGLVELLEQKTADADPETQEIIGMIQDSAKGLSSLIDGILKHAKTNSLLLEERSFFSLADLIKDTLKLLDPKGKQGLSLEMEGESVYANKVAIQQILINLIANAIKYNINPEPKLEIGLKQERTKVIVSISDNGPGIKPEDQERIFKIFHTTSNKDVNGTTGTGIGLATVKSLVEGMGGEISLKSEIGQGSTFYVHLPVMDI